jgi:hypothetical protein
MFFVLFLGDTDHAAVGVISNENETIGAHQIVSKSVPTPPPRARTAQHSTQQRSSPQLQRRTFSSLHEEFGVKILRDQRVRWAAAETTPIHSGFSVAHQDLMNF